jgi:hypothetical protein
VENYESALNENLRRIKINNIFNDENEAKNRIDEYYNNLTQSFVKAEEKITNELYKNKSSNKNWWSREMSTLKKELQKARMETRLWNDETCRDNKRTAKRNFRREQRRCVFIYEEKNNRNIENSFDKQSKEDFWKSFDKYKNCSKSADKNEVNKNELGKNLRELFKLNTEKIENDQEKIEIVESLKRYELKAEEDKKRRKRIY